MSIDLGISPGRFKKGEWVFTCRCGREGEREWMTKHLQEAHGVANAKMIDTWISYMPKRKEYANIRDV